MNDTLSFQCAQQENVQIIGRSRFCHIWGGGEEHCWRAQPALWIARAGGPAGLRSGRVICTEMTAGSSRANGFKVRQQGYEWLGVISMKSGCLNEEGRKKKSRTPPQSADKEGAEIERERDERYKDDWTYAELHLINQLVNQHTIFNLSIWECLLVFFPICDSELISVHFRPLTGHI